jgi:hypothetical protein
MKQFGDWGKKRTLHGKRQSSEELSDALEQSWPSDRNAGRDLLVVEAKKGRDGNNAQFLVMHSAKGRHAAKPQAEESVGPAIGL